MGGHLLRFDGDVDQAAVDQARAVAEPIATRIYQRLALLYPLAEPTSDAMLVDFRVWSRRFLSLFRSKAGAGNLDATTYALLYLWTAHHCIMPTLKSSDRALPLILLHNSTLTAIEKFCAITFEKLLLALPSDIDGNLFGYLLNGFLTAQCPFNDIVGDDVIDELNHVWGDVLGVLPNLEKLRSALVGRPFDDSLQSPVIGVLPFLQEPFSKAFDSLQLTEDHEHPSPKSRSASLMIQHPLNPQTRPAHAKKAPKERAADDGASSTTGRVHDGCAWVCFQETSDPSGLEQRSCAT